MLASLRKTVTHQFWIFNSLSHSLPTESWVFSSFLHHLQLSQKPWAHSSKGFSLSLKIYVAIAGLIDFPFLSWGKVCHLRELNHQCRTVYSGCGWAVVCAHLEDGRKAEIIPVASLLYWIPLVRSNRKDTNSLCHRWRCTLRYCGAHRLL